MALTAAHQGYFYQDILSAYLVADAIASGKDDTMFLFDQVKTESVEDKFDDITRVDEGGLVAMQVKYSNHENNHIFTKDDISSTGGPNLALDTLYESWRAQASATSAFRLCLAWSIPEQGDKVLQVLTELDEQQSWFEGTQCYKIDIENLWDPTQGVLTSWQRLRRESASIDREDFAKFLDQLVIEVGYPKSSLLQSFDTEIERKLYDRIESIGVGIYPNNELKVEDVAHKICNIIRANRSSKQSRPISATQIAQLAGIVLHNGAIEQNFPVDYTELVDTPERITAVLSAISSHPQVVLKAEPGAGKSWFIANLERYYQSQSTPPVIVKHYCYTQLGDSNQLRRITVNTMYGSLIEQLLATDENLQSSKAKRWASNLEELNLVLNSITSPTLLIVDGIDHIWRVYQKNRNSLTQDDTAILEALAALDCSNPNVTLLVVSQPIQQLEQLKAFTFIQLPATNRTFTQRLLENHGIQDVSYDEVTLSTLITTKSSGNALYTKYLVSEAKAYQAQDDFDWFGTLPDYAYNLTPYYEYLYEQIGSDRITLFALCGAAFSLSKEDLKQITPYGRIIDQQIEFLLPVLRYFETHRGYMIYHESFKSFIVEKLQVQGADINATVYYPLIVWLEKQPFFTSKKAFAHLLKLYFEVDKYEAIVKHIDSKFIVKSLLSYQPYSVISTNVHLLGQGLAYHPSFEHSIIINELRSVLYELDHHPSHVIYLETILALEGSQVVYDLLISDDTRLASDKEIQEILIREAFNGSPAIPWSFLPHEETIDIEEWRFRVVQALHTNTFEWLERSFIVTIRPTPTTLIPRRTGTLPHAKYETHPLRQTRLGRRLFR